LRANSLQQGEDDVSMGGDESEQAPRQSTPKEVQEATRVMRKSMEDQDHCPAFLISKNSNLVSIITKDQGGLDPFYYLQFQF